MERKLAAILAADVVGYTALMERDEAGTFERLRAERKGRFEPEIEGHHGRIFKLMGDGLLAEFGSVVDAVECAVSLQRGLAERNAAEPEKQQIQVRIGINLGEVIVEGDDRYGEGVNIASRLEQLAEPGGIWVSGKVAGEVEKKLGLSFQPMGEQKVKNISEPITAYRIIVESSLLTSSYAEPFSLTNRPSIAVLPFVNMSGDLDQQYFSDGITEDIITELSRFRSLFVIARNSSFAFKTKPGKAQEIARELGVSFIIEGSVRRAENRVRIIAQLIDGGTGNHLWAERYDRDMHDIFAVQDDVARSVASIVSGRVEVAGPHWVIQFEC